MSEQFVPTLAQVRDGYRFDPEVDYYDPENAGKIAERNGRAFDRWLAAHDDEIRADFVLTRANIRKIKAGALWEWARFQESALEASHHALDQDELNTALAWIDDAKAYALRIEGKHE